jgi:hypothetical protein
MSHFEGKPWRKGYDPRRWTGGSRRVFVEVTTRELAQLLEVTEETIRRYIRSGRLDPYSLADIIDKYNNRHLLDKRRKESNPPE